MATLTTRELRVIAAIVDGLNNARTSNARLGVPTTPDVFPARFPNGFIAVLRWTEGVHSDDPKRQRFIERCARHREGYVLDLDTPAVVADAIPLQDPQGAKRQTRRRGRVEIRMEGQQGDITEYLNGLPRQTRGGTA
jgi:hypothetical protein